MIEIEMSMKPDYFGTALEKALALFKKEEVMGEGMFKQLLNPIKENLYNFILKSLNFSEDADDVYQETVLRAFKYRKTYKREKTFKTWLFSIAVNEIRGHFNRSKKSAGTVGLEEHLYITPGTGNEELVRVVYEIAQHLGPKQRKVFFLFYDQGFSIREIADITGLKEGNIKFILNRSRESIKETLADRAKGVKNG